MSYALCLRKRIEGIIAAGGGIPDKHAPDSIEDMAFWCVVEETRRKRAQQEASAEVSGDAPAEQLLNFLPMNLGGLPAVGSGAAASSAGALVHAHQLFEGPSGSTAESAGSAGALVCIAGNHVHACVL